MRKGCIACKEGLEILGKKIIEGDYVNLEELQLCNRCREILLLATEAVIDEKEDNKLIILNKRKITLKQEQALRLCHQDFEGLDRAEAAKQIGISERALGKRLAHVEKALPQYFPILTKYEAKIYHYYMVEGWGIDEIAEYTELSENAIYKTLQRTRDKGMYFTETKGRILSYEPSMDAGVKEKF